MLYFTVVTCFLLYHLSYLFKLIILAHVCALKLTVLARICALKMTILARVYALKLTVLVAVESVNFQPPLVPETSPDQVLVSQSVIVVNCPTVYCIIITGHTPLLSVLPTSVFHMGVLGVSAASVAYPVIM